MPSSPDIRPSWPLRAFRVAAAVGFVAGGSVGANGCAYEEPPSHPPITGRARPGIPEPTTAQDRLSDEIKETLAINNVKTQLEIELGGLYNYDVKRLPKPKSIRAVSTQGGAPHIFPFLQSPNAPYLTVPATPQQPITHIVRFTSATREQTWAVGRLSTFNPAYYPMEATSIDPATGVKRVELHSVFDDDLYIIEGTVSFSSLPILITAYKDGSIQEFIPHERYWDKQLMLVNPRVSLGLGGLNTTHLTGFPIEDQAGNLRNDVYIVVHLPPERLFGFIKHKRPQKVVPLGNGYKTADGRIISSTSLIVGEQPKRQEEIDFDTRKVKST